MNFRNSFSSKHAKRGEDWLNIPAWTTDTNLEAKSILHNWSRSTKGFDGYPTTAKEAESLKIILSKVEAAIDNKNETALMATIKNGHTVAEWSSEKHFIGKWYVVAIAFFDALFFMSFMGYMESMLIWLVCAIAYVSTHISYGWYYSKRRKNNELLLGLSAYCAKVLGFSFACLGIVDLVKYKWSDGSVSTETQWTGLWLFLIIVPLVTIFCYFSIMVDSITGLFSYILDQRAEMRCASNNTEMRTTLCVK